MDELLRVFGTRAKSLEILSLLNNQKKVVRQGFFENELYNIEEFCKKNNLFRVKSEFRVLLADEEKRFSDKGLKLVENDKRKGMYFIYFSKDEYLAYKSAYYEITQDHFNLGLLLGYPECCSRFFKNNYFSWSKDETNFENIALENSDGNSFPFYMNIFNRHKDFSLLSHFPCSLSCEKSQEIGKKRLELIKNKYPGFEKKYADSLKGKICVNNNNLIFV